MSDEITASTEIRWLCTHYTLTIISGGHTFLQGIKKLYSVLRLKQGSLKDDLPPKKHYWDSPG